jgi:thymidine phosphorylase
MIAEQGGDARVLDDYSRFPAAHHQDSVVAWDDGSIARLEAQSLGRASMLLGAGRERLDSIIDPAVGLVFEKKTGDQVNAGERICAVYSNDRQSIARVLEMIRGAITISPGPVPRPPLILSAIIDPSETSNERGAGLRSFSEL